MHQFEITDLLLINSGGDHFKRFLKII